MKLNDFKIYIPREIIKPLTWFIIASVVGVIIQSLKAGKLIILDFFWKNYIFTVTTIWNGFALSALMFGTIIIIIALIEVFYYVIMTISMVRVVYYLILTIGKHNTQKILAYLIIIIGIIIAAGYYLPENNLNFSNKNNTCPQDMVPTLLQLNRQGDFLYYPSNSIYWADGVKFQHSYDPPCYRGKKENQNINYFYCDRLPYNFTNKTTEISPQGVIGKTKIVDRKYSVDLVLKEISTQGETLQHLIVGNYQVLESSCKNVG